MKIDTSRVKYREIIAHRSTVTFIAIFAVMIFVLLTGILFLSGIVDAPYEPAFKHGPIKPTYYSQPCLPKDTKPLPLDQLEVNVFNTTDQAGLAASVTKDLKSRGIKIDKTANGETEIVGTADIRTSIHSLREAYTLAEMIPESTVTLVHTNPAAPHQISLLLGEAFDQITPKDAYEQLDINRVLKAPSECTAVDPLYIAKEQAKLAKSFQTPEETPEPAKAPANKK